MGIDGRHRGSLQPPADGNSDCLVVKPESIGRNWHRVNPLTTVRNPCGYNRKQILLTSSTQWDSFISKPCLSQASSRDFCFVCFNNHLNYLVHILKLVQGFEKNETVWMNKWINKYLFGTLVLWILEHNCNCSCWFYPNTSLRFCTDYSSIRWCLQTIQGNILCTGSDKR